MSPSPLVSGTSSKVRNRGNYFEQASVRPSPLPPPFPWQQGVLNSASSKGRGRKWKGRVTNRIPILHSAPPFRKRKRGATNSCAQSDAPFLLLLLSRPPPPTLQSKTPPPPCSLGRKRSEFANVQLGNNEKQSIPHNLANVCKHTFVM